MTRCNRCGYDNPPNSGFCGGCGLDLRINQSNGPSLPPYIPSRPKKRGLIIVGALVVVFIILMAAVIGSMMNGSNDEWPEDGIYQAPASSLMVRLDDISSDWLDESFNPGDNYSVNTFTGTGSSSLEVRLTKYSSLEDANEAYSAIKTDYQYIGSIHDMNAGNRSCYLDMTVFIFGAFQKGNVVVEFEYYKGLQTIYPSELKDVAMEQYEKIQD